MMLVSLVLLTTFTSLHADVESDVITTIILIDRQAELVDVDQFGEVLRRHVAVPDYFSSGRSHRSSLRQSLKMVKDYGSLKEDFSIPGDSDLSDDLLQSFLTQSFVEVNESMENTQKVCESLQEGFTTTINDMRGIGDNVNLNPNHFYGHASIREEYKERLKTENKSKKSSFSHYKITEAHYKQRIRGHIRYNIGIRSYT